MKANRQTGNAFIGCDNKKIQFTFNGDTYSVPRNEIEIRLKIYWFIGPLYEKVIEAIIGSKDLGWLAKYKR